MGFWIFEHTKKQNKKSKINKNKYKTELVKETCKKKMHIKRCMMHKFMIMKHLIHEESYKDRKN